MRRSWHSWNRCTRHCSVMVCRTQLAVNQNTEVRHHRWKSDHGQRQIQLSRWWLVYSCCCLVPNQISWVLSVFILCLLLLFKALTCSTLKMKCWAMVSADVARALTYTRVSSAYEWLTKPKCAMISNNSAVYSRNSNNLNRDLNFKPQIVNRNPTNLNSNQTPCHLINCRRITRPCA